MTGGRIVSEDRKQHPMAWTGSFENLPVVALGGLAFGLGSRFLRGLLEAGHKDPIEVSGKLRYKTPPVAGIPVEVSPQEAEALAGAGVRVQRTKRKRKKTAQDTSEPSFLRSMGYGAAATGAGMLGWGIADWAVDAVRKWQAKQELKKVRDRIAKLMQDEESPQDIKVAHALRRGEQQMLKQGDIGDTFDWVKTIGGLGIGAGTVLSFMAALRQARDEARSERRVKALGRHMAARRSAVPLATMEPVVVEEE